MEMLEHPLLNSVVLSNVFKYCDVEDLPDYRLVCKTWFDVSLGWWRKSKTLTILQHAYDKQNEDKQNEVICLAKADGVTLEELRRIHSGFLQLSSKPYCNYRLKTWKFEDDLTDIFFTEPTKFKILPLHGNRKRQAVISCGTQEFPDFWQKFGGWMKHLHLEKCSFPHTYGYPFLLFQIILKFTPNIEFLSSKSCQLNESFGETILSPGRFPDKTPELAFQLEPLTKLKEIRTDGNNSAQFIQLHRFFPNLETYVLHFVNSPSLQSTIWGLEKYRVGEPPLKIKTLDILHDDNSDQVIWNPVLQVGPRNFIDLKVNTESFPLLSTLALGTMSSNTAEFMTNVNRILKDFSNGNLKTLKLFVAPYKAPVWGMRLPSPIESLKEVELYGNCYSSLKFLKRMPNLERLHISTWAFEMWDEIRHHVLNKRWSQIVNFRTNIVLNTAAERVLAGFVAMNLTYFHLDHAVSQQDLRCLSEWMPYLRCLKAVLRDDTLAVVCGSYTNSSWANLEELHLLYRSLPTDDGIVNLVFLKKLEIFRFDAFCSNSKLGDKSALEGFLKMDNLHTLEICVSEKMSPEIEDKLKQKIARAIIIRNYNNHEAHRKYGKCCKRREFVTCLLNLEQKPIRPTYRRLSN